MSIVRLGLFTCSALLALTARALGAACCGGGFAAPALIVSDDRAQFSVAADYSQTMSTVSDTGLWRSPAQNEFQRTLRIEGARVLNDRYQMGLSLPVIQKYHGAEEASGLGDISLTAGYEYLPDWDYNPLRPQGIGYLQLTAPTGRSVFEAQSPHLLDSRGRGFWSLGLGTILTKSYRRWDGVAGLEVHRSFNRHVESAQFTGDMKPGFGGTLTFGLGWNYNEHRIGSSVSWVYEDPVSLQGTSHSERSLQQVSTLALSYGRTFAKTWIASLSYSDQTMLAEPINATLGRALSLSVQKRWQR